MEAVQVEVVGAVGPEGAEAGRTAIDRILPGRLLGVLGLQHVLVMYAGAVAVPLIVGHGLHLSAVDIALLISADLFACGIATLIQTLGLPGIGIRLPVMMGVTFASVAPMLAIAQSSGGEAHDALPRIYGAVIVAGLFGLLVAPFISRLSRLFPTIVTGTVILVIGISLMRISIDWVAGGQPSAANYGAPINLAIAMFVLVTVLLLMKYGRGLVHSSAVLIGVGIGSIAAMLLGLADFTPVAAAPWLGIVTPFHFGSPRFELGASISMCLVMIVVMVESFGMFMAIGRMVDLPLSTADLSRGLRGDALGTIIGGIFNTFPYTSFSQNVGLIGITGVRSRYVCATAGAVMLLLGLSPKLAACIAAVPPFVLGGAGLIMFGMIAATGINILSSVDFAARRNNLTIVAVSIGIGMIPLVADKFFQFFPAVLSPLLHSGILLTTIAAVCLNLLFNGLGDPRAMPTRSH